jgi:hypothetical protein
MTAPFAWMSPLPAIGTPTGLVRKPVITVTFGPDNAHQTTITNVLSARTSVGLDLTVSEATFTVPEPVDLFGAVYLDRVRITTSAPAPDGSGGNPVTWMGLITDIGYQLWPRAVVVSAKGYLIMADRMKNKTVGGASLTTLTGGATATDGAIVAALFAASGIVDATPSPPQLHVGQTGRILGAINPDAFRWAEKESALAYLQRLDEACAGYRTYDDAGGTIWRVQINAVPGVSPSATFTEGLDIFSGSTQKTILTAANRIVVTGADTGTGLGPVSNTQTGANGNIPNPPQYITDEMSNPMLGYALDADRPAGEGLSCQAAAIYLLSQFNLTQERVQFVTPRDDLLGLGVTIKVDTIAHTADRLDAAGNYYLQHIDREIDEHGVFSQTFTCLSGVA